MNAKEYLQQAFYLDQRINSKLEQVDQLRFLTTKATSTLSDMPKHPHSKQSSLEETVIKIMSLQEEINIDIDKLVDLKRDIMVKIKIVKDSEEQMVLEKRYLCFLPFEQIAIDLNYNIRHIYRLHNKGLDDVTKQFKS